MTSSNGAVSAAEKSVDPAAVGNTVQALQSPNNPQFGVLDYSVLFLAAGAADDIAPWGPRFKERDAQLRGFITAEPLFASALGIVCARNAAFSWKLEGPASVARRYHDVLTSANFGKGWTDLITKVSIDLYTQDCGAFVEIIREQDSPDAPVVGIAHLDAARCWHTGVPEAPVIYQDRNGKFHYLKWYQVVTISEMPAAYEGLPGLQYCALTRMLRAVQILRDVGLYLKEKIGGQNMRAVTLVRGVKAEAIQQAWNASKLQHESRGLSRFSMPVMVSAVDPNAEVGFSTFEVASLPDGFDLDLTHKQYISQIAMAFLSDYQEFAPLPGGNLGTSAQSEILHRKTRGKGPALFQKLITQAFNFFILPKSLELIFDDQDVEGEKALADVRKTRADERKTRIESGEITVEVAQNIAFRAGDLTQEQLDALVRDAKERADSAGDQLPPPAPASTAPVDTDVSVDDRAEQQAQVSEGDDDVDEEEKHLPGGHDQRTHGSGLADADAPTISNGIPVEMASGNADRLVVRPGQEDDYLWEARVSSDEKAATPIPADDPRLKVEEVVAEVIADAFSDLWDELRDQVGANHGHGHGRGGGGSVDYAPRKTGTGRTSAGQSSV